MTKAVILARVSTLRQEKEGLSLKDIQLPELRDYATKRDFEVGYFSPHLPTKNPYVPQIPFTIISNQFT
jgi:hypothetical protein